MADLAFVAQLAGAVVADPSGESVSTLPPPARTDINPEWVAVVGPEGGLDPDELELMHGLPRLSLGPHILRAETAPIAASVLLLDRARDLCREWQV